MKEIKITGKHIYLEQMEPTEQNASRLSKLVAKNMWQLKEFMSCLNGWTNPEQSLLVLKKNRDNYNEPKHGLFRIMKNGQLIGTISAKTFPGDPSTEIIYWLDKNHQGHGYMKEAVQLLEQTLAKNNTKQFTLFIAEDNYASIKLATALGYTLHKNEYYTKEAQSILPQKICSHRDNRTHTQLQKQRR